MKEGAKKIVVVEDHDVLRENISEILSIDGYETYEASNGLEGWKLVLEHQPDLIVSDVNMPVMDGLELLKKIREHDTFQNLPFIFLTVRNTMQELRMGMNYGADDYLAKPFDINQLLSSVKSRLNRSLAENSNQNNEPDFQLRHKKALEETVYSALRKLEKLGGSVRHFAIATPEENLTRGKEISDVSIAIQSNLKKILMASNLDTWERCPTLLPPGLKTARVANIKDLLANRVQIIKGYHQQHVNLEVDSSGVISDGKFLAYVLDELLENGFKFAKYKSTVSISGKLKDEGYEVTISNYRENAGIGTLSNVKPYYIGEVSPEHPTGLGLGLSNTLRFFELTGIKARLVESFEKLTSISFILPT